MFASLNGNLITRGRVDIPINGNWTGDVWISEAIEISGAVTLVIGDLTLKGAVYRGGTFTGRANYRLVGGAGGWMKTIPPKFYQTPFGVKASAVLKDAAHACGETLSVTADRTLGAFYTREKAPAARTLNLLAQGWWMREDGVTVAGPRATPIIASSFEVIKAELEKGFIEVATDFPSQWVPGAKFSNSTLKPQQISLVTHQVTATKLRTQVWTVG